ncbi:hypothetical protein ACIQGT_25530 [Streptomyces sp. NPDC093108]|uniref:hypothetical protein n=1 Tax=Streptomyces sp. NPDC093108 TaxID=3366030 RepID=UPI00382A828C
MHWWVTEIKNDSRRKNCLELATPTSMPAFIESFTTLLRSGEMPCIGIALDYYRSYEARCRHGFINPFTQFDAEVLTCARELLIQPPVTAAHQPEAKEDGANHASALAAIMNLAEFSDADLIADSLHSATTSGVKIGAALAAAGVLEDADVPPLRLIGSLESLIFNTTGIYHEYSAAISALSESDSEIVDAILLRALEMPLRGVQTQAAITLAERNFPAYQRIINEVTQSWPQNTDYPSVKLLSLLQQKQEAADITQSFPPGITNNE